MHRSFTPVILISLLSAGILTFCAPHPVAAQYVRDLHKACLLETA